LGLVIQKPQAPLGADEEERAQLVQVAFGHVGRCDEAISDRRPNCARCNWRSRCRRRSFCDSAWSRSANRGVALGPRRREERLQRVDVHWQVCY
jgi:hypothetical protein